jgi:cation diffusion facilitator family transporter
MKKVLSYEQTIHKVGIVTIVWNVVLSALKFVAGLLASSSSMISDAVHSLSDVFTTFIVMIGARIASKESDVDHPYGHERFESIASIFLGILLAITALGIGYSGVKTIIAFVQGEKIESSNLAYLALISAILSILIKGFMFIYTYRIAKKLNSCSLKADAFHHLSDSLSSIGSTFGVIGLMIGGNFALLDPIASLIICLFILKVAFDIEKEAVNQLVDKAAPDEIVSKIKKSIEEFKDVKEIQTLKTRQFANKIYVDVDICLDKNLTLIESDLIADSIHDYLEATYPDIKHCQIHVNPYREK